MSHPPRRRVVRSTARVAALAVAAGLVTLAPTAQAAPAVPGTDPVVAGRATDPAQAKLASMPPAAAPDAVVSVFVRTSGPGALRVDAEAKGGRTAGRSASREAQERVRAIGSTTAAVADAARREDPQARTLYSTAYTVPGVALVGRADRLAELADRPDVVSVTPLVTKTLITPVAGGATPQNGASDVFTRAVDAWQQTGHTGRGVNVAVIDTGLDYTHADFGGKGTKAAYTAALASTAAPAAGTYDPAKFLGGHDFAGRTYNADNSSPVYQPYPEEDANPVDGPGGGHGTHVAGTIAGYGLDASGKRPTGSYTALTAAAVRGFEVGPGTAPSAGLYSLKVFGDFGGATNLTGAALDWIGRSLTEGKKIDVVNMSLGSSYSAVDDPDNAMIDALVDRGVLPVISAGNSGDLTDVAGSPGNSVKSLAVAASSTGHTLYDGVEVAAPAELKAGNPYLAQYTINYTDPVALTGSVAALGSRDNLTGCGTFSAADAARVKGKIAWLQWDDDDVLCGSVTRFENAQAAGATGVLLTGTKNSFEGSVGGSTSIPGAHLSLGATNALKAAAQAGTLRVSLRDDLRSVVESTDTSAADTLASFSSRGAHGSLDDVVKPDVAAPGVNITSALSGSGTGREQLSGTSMAAPHTAGVAALAIDAHPGWSAARIKTDLMNTATHDTRDAEGRLFSVERQGTGRVDALQAVKNEVTVASKENPGLVTASFGVVDVKKSTTLTRTLVLSNAKKTPVTYAVEMLQRRTQKGVTLSTSTRRVTVPAGGTASVTVTLRVPSASALRRTLDPTSSEKIGGYVREFVAASSAVVSLTPVDGAEASGTPPLRVAVYAAPKPYSTLSTGTARFGKAGSARLRTTGGALDQGSATDGYHALAAPFTLGATSPKRDFGTSPAARTLAASDLRAVGASSTAPLTKDRSKGVLAFGVQTEGPMANPGGVSFPDVLIDVSGDGRPDFETYVTKLQGNDVTVVVTQDLGTRQTVDVQPYGMNVSGRDATTFDSTTAVLPVSLAKLGFTPTTKQTKISYQVRTVSTYAPGIATGTFGVVDSTKKISFDVYRPTLWFSKKGGSDRAGVVVPDDKTALTVHRSTRAKTKALILHLTNRPGDQGQVVTVRS